MEIAFLQLPETKQVSEAPQALSSAEFSMLLASMLGQAVPEASLNASAEGKPEAEMAFEDRDVVSGQEVEVAPDGAQSQKNDVSVLMDGPEAPASALSASVLAPLFAPVEKAAQAPVQNQADQASFMAIDDEADFETAAYPAGEFVAGTRTTHEVTPGAPVDLAGMKSASQPCAAETPEKPMASLAGDEKTAHDVKSPKVSGEPFEVEIPVEAIMRHAAAEEHAKVTSAPASGAPVSPEKAETLTEALPDEFNKPVPDDARATGSVKMKEPAPPEEHGRAAVEDPVEFNYDNEEHGSAAVGEAFELNYGREEDGQDGEEHASFAGYGSRFAPEARPEGLERALSPVSFEKLIEGPAKEGSSQTARLSPTAAEVHEKVQAGIKVSVDSGGGEVRMKLNPESLGEVRIKLNVDSGVVKAEIMVENMEVKRIIESDSSFLKESLGAHGLTLDKCVVEVSRSFDARGREGNGSDAPAGGEQRPPRDREQEKSGTPWQRHYKQGHGRQEDGRLDFFI